MKAVPTDPEEVYRAFAPANPRNRKRSKSGHAQLRSDSPRVGKFHFSLLIHLHDARLAHCTGRRALAAVIGSSPMKRNDTGHHDEREERRYDGKNRTLQATGGF